MSNLISFTCDGCQATLSVPVELAGISGPCPYCATHVTSPAVAQWQAPAEYAAREEVGDATPSEETAEDDREMDAGRPWLKLPPMSPDETAAPRRPLRSLFMAAAGIAVFAGGVVTAYHFWAPPAHSPSSAGPSKNEKPEEPETGSSPEISPRPEVLAAADEALPPGGDLPPPAEDIPDPPSASAGVAVAANMSAAGSSAVPVAPPISTGPESSLLPALEPEPSTTQVTTPAAAQEAELEIRRVVATGGHLEKPGSALVKFFAAKNWQERLQYTLAPGKMRGLMEEYYKTAQDGPIIPEGVELTRIEGTEEDPNRKYYSYVAFLPGLYDGIPLSVEDTKDGCRVEWRSFIESKDQLLAKFFSGFRKEPETFRVLVRRGHYFDTDVPDQSRKVVFDVRPPDGSGPWKVWADKDSVAYTRHFATGERARWEISSMMVLSLQWEKSPSGQGYVRLRSVVADSWHPEMLPKGSLVK